MTRRGGKVPPGRLGLPWLGETTAIASNNHRFYTDRFDKYGPIFKTRLFGINFVVLSGAEAFHRFATDPAIERGNSDPIWSSRSSCAPSPWRTGRSTAAART